MDDYVLLAILSDSPLRDVYPSRLDVFNFLGGTPERIGRMLDLGLLPWWTYPGTQVAFWRPVSALTHWLDHALWRGRPALMHAQNVLWYGALVLTVGLLDRRLMGRASPAAALAVLLYALGGDHADSVRDVAGRNAILGALFGALTVSLHDRWRRAGWRMGAVAAPASLALALLSAETAVATGAYLVAHALFLEPGGWRGRLRAILPHALVIAAWQLAYTASGHGVLGIAPAYLNPLREPLQFALAVVRNGPSLLLAQWVGYPVEGLQSLAPGAAGVRGALVLVGLAVPAVLLIPLLKRDRVARFWGLGHVLAVVPICAAGPHNRYLFFVGLGASGLIAQFVCGLADPEAGPRQRLWRGPAVALACALVVVHLVASPVQLARGVARPGDGSVERVVGSMPIDPAIRSQTVVIVHAPTAAVVFHSFFIRAVRDEPIPARTRVLASGRASLTVYAYRPDERTLRVRWEGRQEKVLRPPGHPLVAGARMRLSGTDVEVTEVTADGWPTEATFRFDATLDDPSLRWLRWTWETQRGRFVPFNPPAIGETVLVR